MRVKYTRTLLLLLLAIVFTYNICNLLWQCVGIPFLRRLRDKGPAIRTRREIQTENMTRLICGSEDIKTGRWGAEGLREDKVMYSILQWACNSTSFFYREERWGLRKIYIITITIRGTWGRRGSTQEPYHRARDPGSSQSLKPSPWLSPTTLHSTSSLLSYLNKDVNAKKGWPKNITHFGQIQLPVKGQFWIHWHFKSCSSYIRV